MVINGHAYTSSSGRRNYKLSPARAVAVARFLEKHGIPASSFTVVGHEASHLANVGFRVPTAGCWWSSRNLNQLILTAH